MQHNYYHEANLYHATKPAGKISIKVTKPCKTQHDLSLAYTPGVGGVCREIAENKELSWTLTNRANTVAIVSDGTAVLGLGNIGAEAGLPVMEGKSVIFKQFADIDALPLCLKLPDINPDAVTYPLILAKTIAALAPSVGAFNLEDIKAPQCFAVQEELRKLVDVPVFHDDQDGTAIIITAGLVNALKIVNKDIKNCKIVINGAGAAGIACAKLLLAFDVKKEQLHLCDREGLITTSRPRLETEKSKFAQNSTPQTLSEVVAGADIFIGVSGPNLLMPEMVSSMNNDPIIFAVANPIPEIMPELAIAAGAKVVGTGRSDYPNQVNNSLGYPGLFRALLDTRCKTITESMLIAATEAIANLVTEPLNEAQLHELTTAYPEDAALGLFINPTELKADYVIPKQFDPRVVPRVARAVAEVICKEGLGRSQIENFDEYENSVIDRVQSNQAQS